MTVRLSTKSPNGSDNDPTPVRAIVYFGTPKTTVMSGGDTRLPRALDSAAEAVTVMTPKQLERIQVEMGEVLVSRVEGVRAGR